MVSANALERLLSHWEHVAMQNLPVIKDVEGAFTGNLSPDLYPPNEWAAAGVFVFGCISVGVLPVCITLTAVTGQFQYLVILAFAQIISIFGIFPKICFRCLRLYALLRPFHVLQALVLAILALLLSIGIDQIPRNAGGVVLQWSWLALIEPDNEQTASLKGNSIAYGFAYFWSAIVFYILLVFFIPVLAFIEEVVFRKGTRSWKDALWRSLLFGGIHIIAGATVGTSVIVLTLVGLVFSREYMEGVRRFANAAINEHVLKEADDDIDLMESTLTHSLKKNPGPIHVEFNETITARERDDTKQWLRDFLLKKFGRKSLLQRIINVLGFRNFAFSILSIGKWQSWNADDLDWDHILNITYPCNRELQHKKLKHIARIKEHRSAAISSSTMLHMTYNLIVITNFFVSIIRNSRPS